MGNRWHRRGEARAAFVRGFACKVLLALAFLFISAGVSGAQVSIGIQIGAPPPPQAVVVLPPTPGPEYMWVEGYWYPVGRHYRWHAGYWTLPPYAGARWVPPHYDEGRFFVGYWDGDHGRFEHDHHWDREHDRDHDRWREHEDRGRHEGHGRHEDDQR